MQPQEKVFLKLDLLDTKLSILLEKLTDPDQKTNKLRSQIADFVCTIGGGGFTVLCLFLLL